MAKKNKEAVHYRRGTPRKRCAQCSMFIEPDACTAVEGRISPQGVCDLFNREKRLSRGGFGAAH